MSAHALEQLAHLLTLIKKHSVCNVGGTSALQGTDVMQETRRGTNGRHGIRPQLEQVTTLLVAKR